MAWKDILEKAGIIEKVKEIEKDQTTKQEPVKEKKNTNIASGNYGYAGPGKVSSDPELKDHLYQAFEKAKVLTPGVDYLDFKKTFSKLSSNLPIKDKYQTIFETLSITAKLTKDSLLKSIDKYIEMTKTEKSEFTKEIDRQIETKVKVNENRIDEIHKDSVNAQKEIEKLTLLIGQNETEIKKLQEENLVNRQKIEETAEKFHVTIDELILELELDKQNINTHIS